VDSFINQTHNERELIIVSDGCQLTADIVQRFYSDNYRIKFIQLPKQPLFSGNVRHAGVEAATGYVIAYLDHDDYLMPSHLACMDGQFAMSEMWNGKIYDWIYFNDYIKFSKDIEKSSMREVEMREGSIGCSSIAHRSDVAVSWEGCDGYGHDWHFISRLREMHPNYGKCYGMSYTVCHIPKVLDV